MTTKTAYFDTTKHSSTPQALSNMTRKDFQLLAKAMVLAANYCDTTFTCCYDFLARKAFTINTKGHWLYIHVDMDVLKQYWDGNSSNSDHVEKLLRYTFGLFAVLSQDHEQHQVLLPGELESALQSANGITPEYANPDHPMVKAMEKVCSFIN